MDRYAVFGNPVAHSLSPRIHARFGELTGDRIEYVALALPVDDFARAAGDFFAAGGRGALYRQGAGGDGEVAAPSELPTSELPLEMR